jgi:uncharacterized membrane protein YeaQ/YmgE (transglycosylase-associated protein family)
VVLVFVLSALVGGLVVGLLGRLLLIGPDPMPWWETLAVGLAASLIANLVVRAAAGPSQAPLVLTVFVATLLVYGVRVYRARRSSG